MRLAARLWTWGALVPCLGTVLVALVGGFVLRAMLEQRLDEALLAQAAVESVSLFDGGGLTGVHLHMASSPLRSEVRPFAPSAEIFGPDGRLVTAFPELEHTIEETVMPLSPGSPPRYVTRFRDGDRVREVSIVVPRPDGTPYTLRLAGSFASVDQTMGTYWSISFVGALLLALTLLVVQGTQARRLTLRLAGLGRRMAELRQGKTGARQAVDAEGDEITELSELIEDAAEKVDAARRSQERLVADAAHELRTPLTLMRTRIDLALRREREPAELRSALDETRRELERLAHLAARLLDLAAGGKVAAEKTPTDLRSLVVEAVDAATAEAEKRGIAVETDLPHEPCVAPVHAPTVRQAIDNLLSNALKYAPAGSAVRIRLARHGDRLDLAVSDEGPGIPAEHREHVFSPFHRVPGSQEGAGLGLAIVREVAEAHGGKSYVADAPKGATVVLELAASTRE